MRRAGGYRADPPAWPPARQPSPRQSDPIIVNPSSRSLCASIIAFIKPVVSPVVLVRSTDAIGSLATRTEIPERSASTSLSPTRPSGGSVNMQYGTSRSRVVRRPPTKLSRMMRKSSKDTCVNWGTSGAVADRPDCGCTCLQTLVYLDVSTVVEIDASYVQSDPGRVRNSPGSDQDVARLERSLTEWTAHSQADALSRATLRTHRLCGGDDVELLHQLGSLQSRLQHLDPRALQAGPHVRRS